MGALPDHDSFVPLVGDAFVLRPEGSPALDVVLVEAKTLPPPGPAAPPTVRRAPYSLLFRADGNAYLPQSMYRVEHESMGRLDLFLVPIGPDDVGMRFEAIVA